MVVATLQDIRVANDAVCAGWSRSRPCSWQGNFIDVFLYKFRAKWPHLRNTKSITLLSNCRGLCALRFFCRAVVLANRGCAACPVSTRSLMDVTRVGPVEFQESGMGGILDVLGQCCHVAHFRMHRRRLGPVCGRGVGHCGLGACLDRRHARIGRLLYWRQLRVKDGSGPTFYLGSLAPATTVSGPAHGRRVTPATSSISWLFLLCSASRVWFLFCPRWGHHILFIGGGFCWDFLHARAVPRQNR